MPASARQDTRETPASAQRSGKTIGSGKSPVATLLQEKQKSEPTEFDADAYFLVDSSLAIQISWSFRHLHVS